MKLLSCSCGHTNPKGTELCGGCGKPISEQANNEKTLNMRYEGAARRSQAYHKSVVDRIWNFFSSVKVGVWIIVILLIASSIGTIFPQHMYIPTNINIGQYYENEFGFLGKLYYDLGFHNLYKSWWYLLLLAALTVSLIIASVDRFFPLYRSLKNQRVKKHVTFMKKQRLVSETNNLKFNFVKNNIIKQLEEKKYKVTTDGDSLLAEKGRFSRWGPYVNHIGLITFLLGGMLRFSPELFVDEFMWIRDGETSSIPGTNGEYYLESDQFLLELYDEDDETFQNAIQRAGGTVVKTYQTSVTLYRNQNYDQLRGDPDLQEIKTYDIRVNEPLKFDRFALYQLNYKLNEFKAMDFKLINEETEEEIGQIRVDLFNPEMNYEINDYTITLKDYFPDFYLNSEGVPSTKSSIPDNPAFIFEVNSPEKEESEVSFLSIGSNFDPNESNTYIIRLAGVDMNHVSGLTVRKDFTLPFLVVGGVIFMIGLVQGSYWTHRRIWIRQEAEGVIIAAHTNKNWFGFAREINGMAEKVNLSQVTDQTNINEEKEREKYGGSE
ncbi:cytochrome c biogenesis protein ResB (plasmid) [Alkalihalophilus sp. As8PL]|uniref:Cytochrome c biogenesis protein ResB n=1 Tax=Alkalihalophilus sp. As8PL TaxID=3237103 RepID=A0AB39BNH1_9BACI